jgi:hypothetical protein
MKFFDWLFGSAPIKEEFEATPKTFRPVPKWTHAGRKGKSIYCPKCGKSSHVFNFSWSALACSKCKAVTDKYDWLLPVTRGKKK